MNLQPDNMLLVAFDVHVQVNLVLVKSPLLQEMLVAKYLSPSVNYGGLKIPCVLPEGTVEYIR